MFWIWSFPFNISSTISGFKLDFNFCLFFCFAFRLLFHTINLLLLLFFAYWCVRVCTFHMCHNIFSICKFEFRDKSFYFIAMRWFKFVVVMAVTHLSLLKAKLHCNDGLLSLFFAGFAILQQSNIFRYNFYIYLCVIILVAFFLLTDVKFRWNSLLLLFVLNSAEASSSYLQNLCRMNAVVFGCVCVCEFVLYVVSLNLMLNYRLLRILCRPDLSLSSLSNSIPLICTRVPERLSNHDPHQHMSE